MNPPGTSGGHLVQLAMSAACLNVTPAAAGSRPAVAIIPHLCGSAA